MEYKKLSDRQIKINSLGKKYYDLKTHDDKNINDINSCRDELLSLLYEELVLKYQYDRKFTLDIRSDAFLTAMEKKSIDEWAPPIEGDERRKTDMYQFFASHFIKLCLNVLKKKIRKEGGDIPWPDYSQDDDSENILIDIFPYFDLDNISDLEIKKLFLNIIIDFIKYKKRIYESRRTENYALVIMTGLALYYIREFDNELLEHLKGFDKPLMETIDTRLLNYIAEKECKTISDLYYVELKSGITLPLSNKVYIGYYKEVKNKIVSDSNMSQHMQSIKNAFANTYNLKPNSTEDIVFCKTGYEN